MPRKIRRGIGSSRVEKDVDGFVEDAGFSLPMGASVVAIKMSRSSRIVPESEKRFRHASRYTIPIAARRK